MAQQTNFPIAGALFVNADGTLTKQGSTFLRTLWLASAGAPQQTGWAKSTTSVAQGPLANYSGSAVPADLATQVALLTQVVGTLINALTAYGILKD